MLDDHEVAKLAKAPLTDEELITFTKLWSDELIQSAARLKEKQIRLGQFIVNLDLEERIATLPIDNGIKQVLTDAMNVLEEHQLQTCPF